MAVIPPLKPGQKAVVLEMTSERKKRIGAVASEVVDLIRAKTESPIEAFAVLKFAELGLGDMVGVRFDQGIVLNHKDVADAPKS